MHRYGKYVKPYWRYFTLGPICMLTEVVGEVLLPSMMAGIINIGVPGQDVGYIVRQGLLMIGVALLMMAGGVGATTVPPGRRPVLPPICEKICTTGCRRFRLQTWIPTPPGPWSPG